LTQARWTGAATLAIQTRYLEEGETASYVLRFDGDRVAVDYAYSTGLRASFSAEAR
jgi:hypothetical protein